MADMEKLVTGSNSLIAAAFESTAETTQLCAMWRDGIERSRENLRHNLEVSFDPANDRGSGINAHRTKGLKRFADGIGNARCGLRPAK
jgi:hypothetical protein